MCPELILWDWNGTLLDDVDLCVDALNRLLAGFGYPQRYDHERYRAIFGFPIEEYYVRAGFDFTKHSFAELAEKYMEDYVPASAACPLADGAIDALEAFKAAGLRQVILSASNLDTLRRQTDERGVTGYFDRLLGFCRKYEIYLLPDLHSVPGGQNPDWHSDNQTGTPAFWHYDVFQQQIISLWRDIAARYRDEPYLLGYDLLNEPFLMPAADGKLQQFYERVTAAVREVDENHIIFLEGDSFAMDFSCLKEIRDEQTALTFHFYPTVWEADLCDPGYPRGERQKVFEQPLALT